MDLRDLEQLKKIYETIDLRGTVFSQGVWDCKYGLPYAGDTYDLPYKIYYDWGWDSVGRFRPRVRVNGKAKKPFRL